MKIAIIGAGFYGCNFAIKIKQKFKNLVDVTIFEKDKNILTGAISNNQHRLHLGFHYPRCDKTINQSKKTYSTFLDEYGECTSDCVNYYSIHNDSMVSFETYTSKFREKSIFFERIDHENLPNIIKKENIEGTIRCEEKVINLRSIVSRIKKDITNYDIKIETNRKIDSIESLNNFDHVINCTYSSPSIGLKNKINTKSELCFMPIVYDRNNVFKNYSFTIMDGPFSSIYQTGKSNYLSVSNVIKTPYYKNKNIDDLLEIKRNLSTEKIKHICEEIMNESSKYFYNLDKLEIVDYYVCMKTKIQNDNNDFRGSFLIEESRLTSIMCGKISCFYDLEPRMIDIIREKLL